MQTHLYPFLPPIGRTIGPPLHRLLHLGRPCLCFLQLALSQGLSGHPVAAGQVLLTGHIVLHLGKESDGTNKGILIRYPSNGKLLYYGSSVK